jgi:hypothetical protein
MSDITQEVLITNFIAGDTSELRDKGGNLKINENQLIHYRTVIFERYGDKFILNNTRYSVVTGRIQKLIMEKVPKKELMVVKMIPKEYCGLLSDELSANI